jgi:hypothetical protein
MHPGPGPDQGPLERWLAEVRGAGARRHAAAFAAAGASDVAIVSAPPDATPFGARLRDIVSSGGGEGLIVLGSGAVPLATAVDRRTFVAAAGADDRRALANNRYSADVVAIARTATLPAIPDLPGDNALPRWLEEVAGYKVDDLGRRSRLGFDIDGPLDVLLSPRDEAPVDVGLVTAQLAAIRAVAADPRRSCSSRVARRRRRWRGSNGTPLPASGRGSRARAAGGVTAGDGPGEGTSEPGARRSASSGSSSTRPACSAGRPARPDARAIVTRGPARPPSWGRRDDVAPGRGSLRLGPAAFERVVDPWLRALTASAAAASIPILLGGHTLVGPGMRLVVGKRNARGALWT